MEIKEEIHKWLTQTIIGLNLCPFAKKPYDAGQLQLTISNSTEYEAAFKDFINELDFMHNNTKIRTSLLVFPYIQSNFLEFNDFCGSLEDVMEENQLDETFQIVCFHPEFVFENTAFEDKANFVNRSPSPLIHILLKEDINQAMSSIQAGENISYINEKTIKSLSENELKKYFWFL